MLKFKLEKAQNLAQKAHNKKYTHSSIRISR